MTPAPITTIMKEFFKRKIAAYVRADAHKFANPSPKSDGDETASKIVQEHAQR